MIQTKTKEGKKEREREDDYLAVKDCESENLKIARQLR